MARLERSRPGQQAALPLTGLPRVLAEQLAAAKALPPVAELDLRMEWSCLAPLASSQHLRQQTTAEIAVAQALRSGPADQAAP